MTSEDWLNLIEFEFLDCELGVAVAVLADPIMF